MAERRSKNTSSKRNKDTKQRREDQTGKFVPRQCVRAISPRVKPDRADRRNLRPDPEDNRSEGTKRREDQTEELVTSPSVIFNTRRVNNRSDIAERTQSYRKPFLKPVERFFKQFAERTKSLYRKGKPVLKLDPEDRQARLNRIFKQAVDLFEDKAKATRWLETPKSALDGETPLSALATDAGTKKVEEILYRAEYGMFG